MNEVESFLRELMGDFCKKVSPINNSNDYLFSYYKNLFSFPTIQMVIQSPFIYSKFINGYILEDENYFLFFLYDLETDMIIGEIEEIYFDEDWKEELYFSIYDAENKVNKYICPDCSFWLVQRTNKYGHKFLGCSDFPECDFSCELDFLEY
jgi:hypothetical protein